MTDVNHRATKNREDALRTNLAASGCTRPSGDHPGAAKSGLCAFSVSSVSLWLTYVITR